MRWRVISAILAAASVMAAASAPNSERVVTLLQTSDIHGHVGLESGDRDWLKLATVIRRERRAAGAVNCLLLDCGDSVQGTPSAALTRGALGLRLLQALRYDVWVPGNHELDFGVGRYLELCDQAGAMVLQGNVTAGGRRFPAMRVFARNGVRVAVLGMNASALTDWLWGESMQGLAVCPAVEALGEAMGRVRVVKPEVVVLAIHQGWLEEDNRGINEVAAIARRFPEIDVILGGHTHRVFSGRRLGRAWYVQPGQHGQGLMRVRVTVEREAAAASGRVSAVESSWLSAAEAARDPAAEAAVAPLLAEARRFGGRVVWVPERRVAGGGTPGIDCGMSDLLSRAIAAETGAEVVFHAVLNGTVVWPAGAPVTERDLFAAVPYENGVGMAMLTAGEIREILTEQLQWWGRWSFNGVWGVEAVVDPGSGRVVSLGLPDGERRYRVAFNSYTVAGGGRRYPKLAALVRRPEARLRDCGVNTRAVLRRYLQAGGGRDAGRAWLVRQ